MLDGTGACQPVVPARDLQVIGSRARARQRSATANYGDSHTGVSGRPSGLSNADVMYECDGASRTLTQRIQPRKPRSTLHWSDHQEGNTFSSVWLQRPAHRGAAPPAMA